MYKCKAKYLIVFGRFLTLFLTMGGESAGYPASFFEGGGGHEAALADLLLLCCLLYLPLFLIGIVRGDRLPHHSRQLASCETSRLFLHRHDGNTAIKQSEVPPNRLGTPPDNTGPEPGAADGSAINARTTQHSGYAISQRKRKRIEECFGWVKTIALLRKGRHREMFKVGWVFLR